MVLPVEKDVLHLSLLYGQQLRVQINSVFDLEQFSVLIAPELMVNCSAHNLETATEKYIDVLKNLIKEYVIIYIDDVIENRLIVTLYDNAGGKIVILEPDEGAFDNVDPLCALPVYNENLSGYVSHANENHICVQPNKYCETITAFLDHLFQYYSTVIDEDVTQVQEGEVYAVCSSDSNWYRGRAIKIDGSDIHVIYVDYGNGEIVQITQLRKLLVQYLNQHMFAIQVLFTNCFVVLQFVNRIVLLGTHQ